jgi:hypothetical protein
MVGNRQREHGGSKRYRERALRRFGASAALYDNFLGEENIVASSSEHVPSSRDAVAHIKHLVNGKMSKGAYRYKETFLIKKLRYFWDLLKNALNVLQGVELRLLPKEVFDKLHVGEVFGPSHPITTPNTPQSFAVLVANSASTDVVGVRISVLFHKRHGFVRSLLDGALHVYYGNIL